MQKLLICFECEIKMQYHEIYLLIHLKFNVYRDWLEDLFSSNGCQNFTVWSPAAVAKVYPEGLLAR